MAIKIQFDPTHNPETPTMILAKKSGEKLGQLDPKSIIIKDDLNNPSEITFSVNKYVDGKKTNLWDKIVDFKLLWCVEWDMWFEITIDIDESTETVKNVYCTELSQAELSQVMLYNIEINTETDISRDDYKNPTIFYNFETPSESLLHRITEKARHYKIVHVDASIAKIQRTFSFDNISLYDALMQIAEEIDCLFVFNSSSDSNGNIQRSISVYDLESNCKSCGHRGQFTSVCPECGSSNITEGYGDDTTIFVDSEELASDIQLTTDTGSVKNCFKLAGGDDLMTATIRNCNPNGTDYIWYLSKSDKEDMSSILVSKLDDYDVLYQMYLKDYVYNLDSNMVSKYNELINKYTIYDNTLETVLPSIQSYPALMKVYYNTVDFELYLKSELMPDAELSDTSAESQVALLIGKNMSPVATTNIAYLSSATADSVVTQMARAIVDSRYKIEVLSSSLTKGVSTCTWTGVFKVTNYSDEEDTATGNSVTITINDNYKTFVEQKLTKALHDKETKDLSIVGLFNMPFASFKNELKKYCLNSLTSFHDACQSCIDILIEQDISNASTWSGQSPNLYNDVYVPYYNMLQALEEEMQLRESEIAIISGIKDSDENVITKGLQTYILELVTSTQKALDFQSYLGENLWKEFVTYRRESKYENSNYVSDGLNNAELFSRALEFIEVAQKEIYKSAELQHSITASLKNLLLMKKFEPLVDYFLVGNWLRIQIDDSIYKLRLLSYEIDFNNLENISVEFSDVMKTADGISDQRSIISRAKNMTTSYSSTQRQANQGAKSNKILKGWSQSGLNTATTKIICEASGQTQTWDEHGMLFRKYDTVTETYSDIQMKIINSTLALTDNNWQTTKTALGLFKYNDPETGELTEAYGINGEVIIGRILLGEQLGIYNEAGTLKFNKNGFVITNGVNSFTVNPNNAKKLLALSTPDADVLYVDEKGMLHIQGDGAGLDISANSSISGLSTRITANAEGLSAEISRATSAEGNLSNRITVNAEGLSAEITRATSAEGELSTSIQANAEGISAEIIRAKGEEDNLSTRITANAEGLSAEISRATLEEGYLSTLIQANAEGLSLRVEKNGVIAAINASSESISISANKINLNGVVTANDYFKINTDGSMECVNAKILAEIIATTMTAKNAYYLYSNDYSDGTPIYNNKIIAGNGIGENIFNSVSFGLNLDLDDNSEKLKPYITFSKSGNFTDVSIQSDYVNINAPVMVWGEFKANSFSDDNVIPYQCISWNNNSDYYFDHQGYGHTHTIIANSGGTHAIAIGDAINAPIVGDEVWCILPYNISVGTVNGKPEVTDISRDKKSNISIGYTDYEFKCLYVDSICLNGETRTAWPSGSGGADSISLKINGAVSTGTDFTSYDLALKSHTHTSLGAVNFSATSIMANNCGYNCKDTSGTEQTMMYINTSNQAMYGNNNLTTIIRGTTIQFGNNNSTSVKLYKNGSTYNVLSTADIGASGGVAAYTHYHDQYLTSHQSLSNYYTKSQVDSLISSSGSGSSTTNTLDYGSYSAQWIQTSDSASDYLVFRPYSQGSYKSYLGDTSYRWQKLNCVAQPNVSSDRNLKDNIVYLDNDTAVEKFFMGLKPVSYHLKYNEDTENHYGYIAQDVEESFIKAGIDCTDLGIISKSTLSSPNKAGMNVEYSLSYGEFTALNTLMTQKAHHRIDYQRKIIDSQQEEITSLKSENQELQNQLLLLQGEVSILRDKMEELQYA